MPCAGLSTRFPNMRPKYLLSDYNNRLMIENAAKNFIGKYNVTIAILKEHDEYKFICRNFAKYCKLLSNISCDSTGRTTLKNATCKQ